MGEHAKLSPSSAKRWLTCPASAEAAARSVSPDTEHSLNGTAAHFVYAEWLLKGAPPAIGTKAPNGVEVTAEMQELVSGPVQWVKNYIDRADGPCVLMVEEKVQIGQPYFGLTPEVLWGTADTIIMAPSELVIADLKAGYVDVPAGYDDPDSELGFYLNEQLALYSLGAAEELGWLWPHVRLAILQPKSGEPKEYQTTRQRLQQWGEKNKPKVTEAASPNARFVPHEDGCRFCPNAGVCKALQTHTLEIAKREFADDPTSLVANISLDELSIILQKADLIEGAIKAAREHAKKLIQVGQAVPGFKVVEGKKNRQWVPGKEHFAAQLLKDQGLNPYSEPSLISPAQAEKLMKGFTTASELGQFIEKPKGDPVLVSDKDRRPALPPSFDAIDTGNLLD